MFLVFGFNPGFDAAIQLFLQNMPEMARIAEIVATRPAMEIAGVFTVLVGRKGWQMTRV